MALAGSFVQKGGSGRCGKYEKDPGLNGLTKLGIIRLNTILFKPEISDMIFRAHLER